MTCDSRPNGFSFASGLGDLLGHLGVQLSAGASSKALPGHHGLETQVYAFLAFTLRLVQRAALTDGLPQPVEVVVEAIELIGIEVAVVEAGLDALALLGEGV